MSDRVIASLRTRPMIPAGRLLTDSALAAVFVAGGTAVALLVNLYGPLLIVAIGIAAGAGVYLINNPAITLGLLMVIGTFKAAPALNELPVDLTVVLIGILVCSIGRALYAGERLAIPREPYLLLPIVLIMVTSLLYTPDLEGGLNKASRFVVINGVSIVAVFLLLRGPGDFERMFTTLIAAGFVAALTALPMLGGKERLTTPGGDTIQLGHDSALAIALLLAGYIPGRRLRVRLCCYGVIGVLSIAMLGAGSRGPFIGFAVCVVAAIRFRRTIGFTPRSLLADACVAGFLAGAIALYVRIPDASIQYLNRLFTSGSTGAFLGPRAGLLTLGWHLMLEHPLTGVGINGFPVLHTGIGNWPHSIPLELGAELGVISVVSFCTLLALGMRTSFREFLSGDARWRTTVNLVFFFLITESVSMLNTGNLNDNRQLWICLMLPFAIRELRRQDRMARELP